MLCGALADVLADKSYTIPTEEAKCCLLIAQKLVSILGEPYGRLYASASKILYRSTYSWY